MDGRWVFFPVHENIGGGVEAFAIGPEACKYCKLRTSRENCWVWAVQRLERKRRGLCGIP